jgi:hypothetical protein
MYLKLVFSITTFIGTSGDKKCNTDIGSGNIHIELVYTFGTCLVGAEPI